MPGGRQIFPNYSSAQCPIAKIQEKQVQQKAAAGSNDL